jgi:hypothetical protein
MANEQPNFAVSSTLTPVPEDDFEKITVTLPRDTIQKLDAMARTAMLGSRGRAIQALVDAVKESESDIGQILLQIRRAHQARLNRRPGLIPAVQNAQEQLAALNSVMFTVGQILTRMNKFLGIRVVDAPQSVVARR